MRRVCALTLALVAVSLTADAYEPHLHHRHHAHGTACQPRRDVRDHVGYGESGAGNFAWAREARVFCPVDLTASGAAYRTSEIRPDTITVFYEDAHDAVPFWCYVWMTDLGAGGAQYWSARKFSCDTPGGCAERTTRFTGYNHLSWWRPFGDRIPSWTTMGVSCSIPRTSSAGTSWVTGYDASTSDRSEP